MRAYVASPADLKQLNAPPAPRAAQRVADPVKWAVATPSLKAALRERAAVGRVAGGRRRGPEALPRDAADGAEYGRRPAGDGPERADALDVVLLRGCRRSPSPSRAWPERRVSFDRSASASTDASSSARSPPGKMNGAISRQGPPPRAPRRWPPRPARRRRVVPDASAASSFSSAASAGAAAATGVPMSVSATSAKTSVLPLPRGGREI